MKDKDLAITKFKIQFCDVLVHNSLKLEKWIAYVFSILKKLLKKEDIAMIKKILYDNEVESKLLDNLIFVIKEMGLDNEFCLGENAEQRVCLNKNNNLWEVYIVERGVIFDKVVFDECFDACIEVLNKLSDSEQVFEKNKNDFIKAKKLIYK